MTISPTYAILSDMRAKRRTAANLEPARPIEIEVALRPRNQLTLPAEIAEAIDARPGDRLVVELDPANPATATLRLVRRSYFAALAGSFGSHEEILDYVRGEQEAWGA